MPKINILPAKVYNRIAAGEVVDRPYSVVKELVENAIDAGATDIEIYVEQGGKQLIRVVDNGCGIEREDLQSAFLPHATSKIAKAEDLDNIFTLGFRGEAVASIAAVSKMTITSKTKTGKCYSLCSDGGELGQIKEVAGENGTDVSVEMLFFNTPVRLGFLKTDKGEETDITNFISRFILNRPEISFTYYVNGKKTLQSFGGGVAEALVGIYGASTLSQCYEIDAEKHGIRIRGYIGNQNFFKPNKSYQSVFLNGRYIQNVTISSAISNAYSSYAMKRQYPFYVLYIDVPREIVDVNVHPNKADVRFADNKIIYGCIYTVISAVLDGQTKAMEYVISQPKSAVYEEEAAPAPEIKEIPMPSYPSVLGNEKLQWGAEEKDKPESQSVFGFKMLSYEEAQKEIEACAPAFVAQKNAPVVPFEEIIGEKKDVETGPRKGFFPIDEIEDYVGYTQLEVPYKRRKTKKTLDNLKKKFPDLYVESNEFIVFDPAFEAAANAKKAEVIDPFEENKRLLNEAEEKAKQNKIDIASCVYVGKLFNTYLLYQCRDDVYIIDQHAAHERLIFNRLKGQMNNRAVAQQPMLVPYKLSLNVFEREFIEEHILEIQDIGFEIELTEGGCFIAAIPLDLQQINLDAFFQEILSDIGGYKAIRLTDILKDKLASAACKAAVKGGMDLTQAEIDALFALMDGDMGLKCPHGRPVVVKMSRVELEKMFKRIV